MFGRVLVCAAFVLALVARTPTIAQDAASKTEKVLEQPSTVASTSKVDSQTEPAVNSDQISRPQVVARDPRVLFITARDNEKCLTELIRLRTAGGPFDAMKSRGWKIGPGPENHVQIVDREVVPEFVKELNVREFPVVACVSEGHIIRSFKDGCTTPLDAWTFGFLITGKNERPAAVVSEPARVASTGSYRLRGNHWSIDGDWNPSRATVVSHLRSSQHGYRIASNWRIESWSYEELRSLHDDLHEQEQQYTSSSSSRPSSSNRGTSWPKSFNARP